MIKPTLKFFLALAFLAVAISDIAFAETLEDPAFTDIVVSKEGQVLVVELDSPPINGISVSVLQGINAALDIALSEEAIRAIVITGQDQLFSGGAGEITDGPDGLEKAFNAFQKSRAAGK